MERSVAVFSVVVYLLLGLTPTEQLLVEAFHNVGTIGRKEAGTRWSLETKILPAVLAVEKLDWRSSSSSSRIMASPVDAINFVSGLVGGSSDGESISIAGQQVSSSVAVAGGAAAAAATALVGSTILPILFPPSSLASKSTIQSILRGTYLERCDIDNIRCVYKASRDGWSATNFHDAVDGRGSGIVVARTGNVVFGGYNPTGWRSTDDYYSSTAAFLWAVKGNGDVDKFKVLPGGDAAVFDYATSGPCFGSSDLLIGPPRAAVMGGFAGPDMEDTNANAGDLRLGSSSVGITYDSTSSSSSSFSWPIRGKFRLIDLEVYCNENVRRI